MRKSSIPKRKTRISEEVKKGVKYLNIGLMLVLIISGTLFILNISVSGQKGYHFKQQETINEQLRQENRQLQLKVLQAASFNNIQKLNVVQQMIPMETVEYFKSRLERLSRK